MPPVCVPGQTEDAHHPSHGADAQEPVVGPGGRGLCENGRASGSLGRLGLKSRRLVEYITETRSRNYNYLIPARSYDPEPLIKYRI